MWGAAGARLLERWSVNQGDEGSSPTAAPLTLRQLFYLSPTVLIFRTIKSTGPFYLMSMPGKVKDPTRGEFVTCCALNL